MTFRNVGGARGVANVNSPPVSSWRIPTRFAKVIRVLIDEQIDDEQIDDEQIDGVTGVTAMTLSS
jgi:hypothetical protein